MEKVINKLRLTFTSRAVVSSLFALLAALIFGAIIVLVLGGNPAEFYINLIVKPLTTQRGIGNILGMLSWIIPVGLSFLVAFKAGLFNIGMPGQMLFSGFIGIMFALNGMPWPVVLPIMIIMGALYGAIPGVLKAFLNVHEVVTCIMLNWISVYVFRLFIMGSSFQDALKTGTNSVAGTGASLKASFLDKIFPMSNINLGIFFALILVAVVWFIFKFTRFGFQLKVTGINRRAAKANGINEKFVMISGFAFAGALAAVGAAALYLGIQEKVMIPFAPQGEGFQGIVVSLLAWANPIALIFSSTLMSIFNAGRFLAVSGPITAQVVDTVVASILIFIIAAPFIYNVIQNKRKKRKDAKNGGVV